jgi:hypothetical protein
LPLQKSEGLSGSAPNGWGVESSLASVSCGVYLGMGGKVENAKTILLYVKYILNLILLELLSGKSKKNTL